MSFWQGPAPTNSDEAVEEFEQPVAFMEDDDVDFAPPTPAIQAFITELLRRFPPLDESSDEDTNVRKRTSADPPVADPQEAFRRAAS